MKKQWIAVLLILVLAFGLAACTSAGPGQIMDGDGMVWYGVSGNLLKLEGDQFSDGLLEGVRIDWDGEVPALVL